MDPKPAALFNPIIVNQAPVLTLWGAVIAERLGYPVDTALTVGRAVAGSPARIQRKSVGREIWRARTPRLDRKTNVTVLLGKSIQLLADKRGEWRAAVRPLPARYGKAADDYLPTDPAAVKRYLVNAFGNQLEEVRQVMEALAVQYDPQELNRIGFQLYEKFRPEKPPGHIRGGAKGLLDAARILAAM